tara:strand:+ start:4492 stop:5250 length:759 start_codon:yes stop_codon:yes gene_type:complete
VENLTKYVMGVAAKSNVEKRQVGCVITLDGEIVAEGYNEEHTTNSGLLPIVEHAEAAACKDMCAEALTIKEGFGYVAHVTHPPCPACAKMLTEYGVTKVVVVEAFMKFDSDKTRLDLVDPGFAKMALTFDSWGSANYDDLEDIKLRLFSFAIKPECNIGEVDLWKHVLGAAWAQYDNFYVMEEALAKVLTFGASKYKPNNWKECSDTGRYLAAAHRHLNAIITGEDYDPETGLPHLDHMLCNLMFLHVLGLK